MYRWAPLLAATGAASGLIATQTPIWGTSGKGTPQTPVMADVVPSRSQQLGRLRDNKVEKPYDILIIGGGATGTGCAWDAATRGLRTALVEREDFSSGTSSKSTKLVHGGVRYLEKAVMNADMGQFKLVYEALHERKVFLENAPHLSKPLPILMAYDMVAGTGNLIWSKYVGPTETLEMIPTLAQQLDGRPLKGSILYYDGQFDDSRMAVTLACSAAAAGATTLNYMEAAKMIKNDEGKVVGVQCRDRLTGEEVDVHARVVINATGPFLDNVRHLSDPKAVNTVTASKGAHITLPGYLGSTTHGIIIPKTPDGRVVFLLPFQDHLIVGTTDSEHEVTNDLRTNEEELSYILTTISNYLGMRVSPADVLSAWSGIRPLPSSGAAKAKDTASVVRDHVIFMDDDGLLNVTGGKWTTFRRMAEEVIDAAVASGRLPMNTKPCTTGHQPVLGATTFKKTTFAEVAQQFVASQHTSVNSSVSISGSGQVSLATVHHLVQAYGDRASEVLALAEKPGLGQLLVPGHPYLQAEVVYCVQNEYCMTAEDFLARRTRLAFLDVRAAKAAVPKVVALMAPLRGWDEQAKLRQIAAADTFLTQTFTAGPEPVAGSGQVK